MKNNRNHDYSSDVRSVEGAFEWRVSSREVMDKSRVDKGEDRGAASSE